jgi:uncharacterized membrane protein
MIRSIVAIGVLLGAVVWTPVWFQCVLFALSIAFLPKKVLFLIPAIVADALYAPTHAFSLSNLKMTMIVIGMLLLWLALMQQTRISHVVPTK